MAATLNQLLASSDSVFHAEIRVGTWLRRRGQVHDSDASLRDAPEETTEGAIAYTHV